MQKLPLLMAGIISFVEHHRFLAFFFPPIRTEPRYCDGQLVNSQSLTPEKTSQLWNQPIIRQCSLSGQAKRSWLANKSLGKDWQSLQSRVPSRRWKHGRVGKLGVALNMASRNSNLELILPVSSRGCRRMRQNKCKITRAVLLKSCADLGLHSIFQEHVGGGNWQQSTNIMGRYLCSQGPKFPRSWVPPVQYGPVGPEYRAREHLFQVPILCYTELGNIEHWEQWTLGTQSPERAHIELGTLDPRNVWPWQIT